MTGVLIAIAVVLLALAASVVVLAAARRRERSGVQTPVTVISPVERDDQFVEQLRRGGTPPDLVGRMLAAWRRDVWR